MTQITLRPVRIATDEDAENGVLVLVNDCLVAVLTRLEADHYDADQGHWFIEAGFGRCAHPPDASYPTQLGALHWIAGRLGLDGADLPPELDKVA